MVLSGVALHFLVFILSSIENGKLEFFFVFKLELASSFPKIPLDPTGHFSASPDGSEVSTNEPYTTSDVLLG